MSTPKIIRHRFGPDEPEYSVPKEARQVLEDQILQHPWIRQYIPPEASKFASSITFVGNSEPSIPVNWRFAESAAALSALEASLVAALVHRKYNIKVSDAIINTDHAQLSIMSSYLWTVYTSSGTSISALDDPGRIHDIIPNCNLGRRDSTLYRKMATGIYKTSDGQFFNLHANFTPDRTLDMLKLPRERDALNDQDAVQPYIEKCAEMTSSELEHLSCTVSKLSGVICQSPEAFRQTEHGKAIKHVSLFEIHDRTNSAQQPCWWSDVPQTSSRRPLAGLKVVDISRVIAAPTLSRYLAELGASVIRVGSANLPDISILHIDVNWGKWTTNVNLELPEGRQTLRDLVLGTDVVVNGYRPGSLEKFGFGSEDIIEIVKSRPRGIISVRENCYGWYGPWSQRPGWQQISDSCTGVSHGFGKAMGLAGGESVTPIFPNSDYMAGLSGACGVLAALMRQAESGGSFLIDVALNYYNQWLINSVGEYPSSVWNRLWSEHDRVTYRYASPTQPHD